MIKFHQLMRFFVQNVGGIFLSRNGLFFDYRVLAKKPKNLFEKKNF
jgi:hypothetical protein